MIALVAIVLGTAIAFLWPAPVSSLAPTLKPAFAVTMFFVGTLVEPEKLAAMLRSPGRPLVGLTAQYTIMPLTAYLISLAFSDPVLRVGIVLVGCVPGAMASNVMSVLFRADVALSVTLTTLATLLCPLLLGFWLSVLTDTRVDVDVGALVLDTLWMVVGPVATGIAVRTVLRRRVPRWLAPTAATVAATSIVLIVMVVVALNQPRLRSASGAVVFAMLALNATGYALAFVVARGLGWERAARRTLVIEVGMQNAGLGSVLATHHLGAAGALPAAFYTALCVVTAALALPWVRRAHARKLLE